MSTENSTQYHKIHTMFKRDMEGDKKIVFDSWVDPTVEYLKYNDWEWTEKIAGTNIRVIWNGEKCFFGGRTDNAQIPQGLVNRLNGLFTTPEGNEALKRTFDYTIDTLNPVVLYGEGYGAGIQSGGKYKNSQDFVLFDVKIGKWWLERPDVEDIAHKLGLETVPIVGKGNLYQAIEFVRSGENYSHWGDFEAEGIVARPMAELLARNGHRIISKIKAIDFR